MHGIIYALIDPRTFAVRYIGQTVKPLDARIAVHLTPSQLARHSYIGRWLGGMLQAGYKPVGVPIATAHSQAELDALEIAFIASMRAAGARLVNLSDGGGGRAGYVPTPEEREKIAAAQRGVPKPKHSDESRRRRSERGMPWKLTPEIIARRSESKRNNGKRKPRPPRRMRRSGDQHHAYRDDISDEYIFGRLAMGATKRAIARELDTSTTFVHRRIKQAQIAFAAVAKDGIVELVGALCDPCFAIATQEAAELRREFDAMIEAGVSRDEANHLMIAKIEGRQARA